jgi:hypothetical protein
MIFALMLVIAGFEDSGVYGAAERLVTRLSDRLCAPVLVILAAAAAVIATPTGAVMLFLPLLHKLFRSWGKSAAITALTAMSCNLGGFISPQESYLSRYVIDNTEVTAVQYRTAALPLFAVGMAVCVIAALFIGAPNANEKAETEQKDRFNAEPISLTVYIIIFILCVLSLAGFLDIIVSFCSAVLVTVILDPQKFRHADYGLLLTLFFLAVGAWNILRTDMIPLPEEPLSAVVYITQIVGNTNAVSLMFPKGIPGLTLLLGVNIGSLGSLAASYVNIIAFKKYLDGQGARTIGGLIIYTLFGAAFITIMFILLAIKA